MQAVKLQPLDPLTVRSRRLRRALFWAGLIIVSAVPRVLGAFLLPNAFGDAYAYFEAIDLMRAKMVEGVFTIKDLYGFWLPLYQFVCALLSLIWNQPFYLAKLVSALCGAGICLLVYQLSLRLTSDRRLSLLAWALVALSPLHILYSSSSLTDIPHALPVLASLYLLLEKRWRMAALFAAAAGFMRLESWMLIGLLPALQFFLQRSISRSAFALTLVSPLLWLYISWQATGDPLAYFEERNRYVVEYTAANPVVATFSAERLRLDAERLFASTNYAVLVACLIAAGIIWRRARQLRLEIKAEKGWEEAIKSLFPVATADIFFFSYLGFLLLAYLSGNQPDIWSRYGLIFFVLGMPVLAWTYQALGKEGRRRKLIFSLFVVVVFLYQTKIQIDETVSCVSDEAARIEIAAYLEQVRQRDPDLRLYCEDGNVRFHSGIGQDRFLSSSALHADGEESLRKLREAGVEYVVCTSWEQSSLTRLFPELREGTGNNTFQLLAQARSKRSSLVFWVYRIRQQ